MTLHPVLRHQIAETWPDLPIAGPQASSLLGAISETYREGEALLEEMNQQLRDGIRGIRDVAAQVVEQRLELFQVLDCLPDAAAVVREGKLLFVNPVWVETLGYRSAAELLGRSAVELGDPEDTDLEGQLRLGVPTGPVERRFLHRDGRTLILELTAARQIDFAGGPAILLVARDVTERKQLEHRLAVQDRLVSLGTLAAGVAHEINNPLSYVLANLAYAAEQIRDLASALPRARVDELTTVLAEARDGAERVRAIVRDLKTLSRPDESEQESLDLRPILESAINLAGNEIRQRARLIKELERVSPVSGNPGRLAQVFVNLLVNAAQALPDGAPADESSIRVRSCETDDGEVCVEIEDSGPGIPPEIRHRLFDPFFTTKPGIGTGLGLSICQSIVRAHHGRLVIEDGARRGTVVRVLLPRAACSRSTPWPVAVSDRPAPRHCEVLIVDDEPLVAKSLARSLQRDHHVVVETDARGVLTRLAAGERYDVILCDLMMPGMDGIALHEQLERSAPALARRVVFVTGGAFTQRARGFLDRVRNPRIEKPCDAGALRALIAHFNPGLADGT